MLFQFRNRFTLFLVFSFLMLGSQVVFAGDEWREVTREELEMKTSKVEPNADAEAIFWEIRIDDSSDDLAMNHYVRVKVFNERGREKYSKVDIPYIRGIKIKNIAARIIKPDGTIVELKKDDIFEREIIKAGKIKVKAKSFAVPNIEPGVIVEYRYSEVIDDASARGMQLEFQRDIPVQKLSYYYKPYNSKEPSYQAYNFTDTKFVKGDKGFYLAERVNVPSFKEEPMMPPENMVRPWMLLSGASLRITGLSEFSISYTIKDPSNPTRYWSAVGAESSGFIKFINKSNKEIKKAAEEVTASASTPEEKLRKIYEFVQTKIKNTTFDTSLTDEARKKLPKIQQLSDVLKHGQASAQYIDMLFGAMANSVGFETRVAMLSDRSKMFFTPNMTNDSFISPGGIAVKVGEKWNFYNPGMKFLSEGMLSWYEEGVWALLVGEKDYVWVETPLTDERKSKSMRSADLRLLEDGTLEGNVKVEYYGQSALQNRLDAYESSAEKQIEDLKKEIQTRLKTAEISNLVIENMDQPDKPLIHKYDVRIPNYAQKTGKRIFLQPGFFEYGESPLFSESGRKYNIYFRYPWSEEDKIKITLPKGYNFDNADAPNEISDEKKIGSLNIKISVAKDASFLLYERKFHFGGNNTYYFPASAYQPIKGMFDLFHKSDSHTITLKQL